MSASLNETCRSFGNCPRIWGWKYTDTDQYEATDCDAYREAMEDVAAGRVYDTIAAKYIKLDEATASSKKYARYVPFWV